MKIAVFVLLAVIGATSAETSKWVDFRAKFSFMPSDVDKDAFFQIKKTLGEALEAGWIIVDAENDLGATTVCLSEKDLNVCPLYDGNEFIAGMLLAIPEIDLQPNEMYDPRRFDVYEMKKINGNWFWTSTYYIVSPNVIAAGGRSEASTIGEGLWIKSGSKYTEVPTDIESIKEKTNFKWQNCVPNMGQHYYYNMTKELDCRDFYPFFILAKDGNMLGVGWQVPGRPRLTGGRNWFENISGPGVQVAVPLGPQCLYSLVDNYGVVSLHMYFVDKPWTITCDHSIDSVLPPK